MLQELARADPDLAKRVVDLPWFTDDLIQIERDALSMLHELARADLELAKLVIVLPWFTDDLIRIERDALSMLQDLVRMARADLELAKLVVVLPWFTDDLIRIERDALSMLQGLARADPDLVKRVVDLPLLTDDLTTAEIRALRALQGISSMDLELARLVVGLPWFADGVTVHERDVLSELRRRALRDAELARRVANLSWFADGVTIHELRVLTVMPAYALRTWDFTDSDGDGMIDAAETKYGFDPDDAASFPGEPEVFHAERHPIRGSETGAYYELGLDSIEIRWTDPEDGSFVLSLRTADSAEWDIYYGGHYPGTAPVKFGLLGLSGKETLVGRFSKYAPDRSFVEDYSEFTIDLASLEMPDRSVIGNPSNRLSYTFSSNFPEQAEAQYREFLSRVFPLMYGHLGPPAQTINVHIEYVGDTDSFTIVDDGRTLLTDAGFIPRLIVHEFVHAWNGGFNISRDENWEYDDALTGFEEGLAEGMAYEVIHEYARSYPTHSATIQLLEHRPYQYWSAKTTSYDAIKNVRWTGAGDFWTLGEYGAATRYSIAATTVQMMIRENAHFMKEFMARYHALIRDDPDWRPNRDDVAGMWADIVPTLNGYPLMEVLDTLPVFNGRKLDEGVYVLDAIRAYGEAGDQQFAVAYANRDGRLWWAASEEELDQVPEWIRTSLSDGDRYYIDTQASSFTVKVYDAYGKEYAGYNFETSWDRYPDGTPTGLGWFEAGDLRMEKFPIGLYRETVTFTDYAQHDEGATQDYYFFGVRGFEQDLEEEYVIMIGVDGVPEGKAEIVIDGRDHIAPIKSGVAIFRSRQWPFDMQGRFPITVTNAESASNVYYRTLIEAGTLLDYFQHQFIIVDTDFDGIEDQFE